MRKYLFLPIVFLFTYQLQAQEKQNFKIASYNVENFFDCVHDSLTNDTEFTANGVRGWTYAKYKKKQANIARVITAIGGWDAPELVGLWE